MSTIAILAAFAVINLLLTAAVISLAARLLKAGRTRFGWALLCVLGNIALTVGSAFALRVLDGPAAPFALLGVDIVLSCLLIAFLLKASFWRAVLIWLGSLVPSTLSLVFALFVLKPYVLEAFFVPSNNMSPTIVGWHAEEKCPHCGGRLFLPMADPSSSHHFMDAMPSAGICADCLKSQEIDREKLNQLALDSDRLKTGDRILVNKLHTPRRWDIVMFRYPRDPKTKYIMRLVALPGEKVFLKDGAVWADGKKLEMPKGLEGLRYGEDPGGIPTLLGTEKEPLQLGPTDYAVLGDFTERSSDSRYWGKLPGDHIEGVVTLCYWPRDRWKILR